MLVALCLAMPAAFAAGSDATPAQAANTDFAAGRAAIGRQDWNSAVATFEKVVAQDKKNADAYNWLGYANRKAGKLDAAFRNYDAALAINPKHRGAHEYVGEAYLMVKDLPRAQEQLAILAKLCNSSCEEYRDLQQAVTKYTAAN
jgi:tetratricopeptide (TPR) repeat protein